MVTHFAHTPGPLKAQGAKVTNARGSHFVADCGRAGDLGAEANARLFAAAPDLLAALGRLVDAYIDAVHSNAASRRDPARDAEVVAARAAIRKAEAAHD